MEQAEGTDTSNCPITPWNGTDATGTDSAAGMWGTDPASRMKVVQYNRQPMASDSYGKAWLTV